MRMMMFRGAVRVHITSHLSALWHPFLGVPMMVTEATEMTLSDSLAGTFHEADFH